jgi:hypothetical protein
MYTFDSSEWLLSDVSFCKAVKRAFQQYVSGFYRSDDPVFNQHIRVKQNHTARVCHEINSIGKSLNFNTEQLAFAELIAWLHDIGRFEQFVRYGTFADAESENHAQIALRVIESEKMLRNVDDRHKEVILRSILNHNIPEIPGGEPAIIDFYSRLLRDADKLDIWRLTLEMNIFHTIRTEAMPPHYDIPERLMSCFSDEKAITLDHVQSFYDSILFRLSWIYDLNFNYSFEQIFKRKIVHQLVAKLPPSDTLEIIEIQANRFINKRISKEV